MKTILIFSIIFAGITVWFFVSKSPSPESEIIARNGLHWHANLSVNIFGETQDIPAGLGLERLPHNPMHTHDRDGVIHMEFAGLVKENDLLLGNFFKIWRKTFPEGQSKMLVNGKENSEFENYVMQDGDKIEIIFE